MGFMVRHIYIMYSNPPFPKQIGHCSSVSFFLWSLNDPITFYVISILFPLIYSCRLVWIHFWYFHYHQSLKYNMNYHNLWIPTSIHIYGNLDDTHLFFLTCSLAHSYIIKLISLPSYKHSSTVLHKNQTTFIHVCCTLSLSQKYSILFFFLSFIALSWHWSCTTLYG